MSDISPSVVCLVDDDPSVQKAVGRLLQSDGYQAHSFGEPSAFLDYLATHPVPVAVLDIWMAEMTGMDLLNHLSEKSPQTRVIFITGQVDETTEDMVMRAGAFAFFPKPIDDKKFLTAVGQALAIFRAGKNGES